VFDIRGAHVARLEEGVRDPGTHIHVGFPDADVGSPLGAGVYVLRLSGPGFSETRRIIVLTP
ncbi:MAG TPA: T9SS type A sorting domain-containing protein, partial [Candidatus Eisenbacteria bacterium]|nr:T9SS type A sorting domain-containing protein [Candidatus Eisenbacteria bacterium]